MIDNRTKVLIVDDFELIRNIIHRAVQDMGLENIEQASGGQEAIECLDQAVKEDNPFGLIFLDWNMPEVNGMDVLRHCRSLDKLKEIPVIMVTAEAEKAQVLRAFSEGVDDYIVKPCSPDMVQRKVQSLVKKLQRRAG